VNKIPWLSKPSEQNVAPQTLWQRWRRSGSIVLFVAAISLIIFTAIRSNNGFLHASNASTSLIAPAATSVPTPTPTPTPIPFNPNAGAALPTHRIIAFYGIAGADVTGPAYKLDSAMLNQLQTQGAAYQKLDPAHPVDLGIDLVVSIPDGTPGPSGTYSHHLDAATIQKYIDFCQQNNLLLFLDLNFGWSAVMPEVDFFLPYLEKYAFVHMAIDPEWMFPNHDGIPGIDLSNVKAADINPIIEALAAIPMKYHVPRKILIIHQYRADGDGTSTPNAPGKAEIADKRDLISDPRVDTVIHVDSVGNFTGGQLIKETQYSQWVQGDMQKYHDFEYGGFKLFYHLETGAELMTPAQVLAMKPAPMIVTYGN
jgi:hypothetical protein